MGKASIRLRLVNKSGWVVAAKIFLALFTLVFAASITVNPTSYQAAVGSYLSVSNQLRATDKGFTLATSSSSDNGLSCSGPIVFSSTPGTANTNITAGHLVYNVQVNSTSSAMPSHNFNVTFVLGASSYGPLCVQTPASPVDGQTINCEFDIGTNSLPSAIYSFKVVVQ